MTKLIAIALGVIFLLTLIVELALRWKVGLGKPLIYLADEEIGYVLAPNQQVRRRGNAIRINAYSMRGDDIEKGRSPSTFRLFLVGDSIANGGWWTPQDQTISALTQDHLQPWAVTQGFKAVEVLNASANSWGPRNERAYLQRFGTFEAQVVVLLINTDDFFATAPKMRKVGLDPNYPDHLPLLALTELYGRYLLPRLQKDKINTLYEELNHEEGDRVGFNLDAIHHIHQQVTQANGRFILAHTPLLREVGAPGPRGYEQTARQRLQDFVTTEAIPYINFLPMFNDLNTPEMIYSDHIHLNVEGNKQVMEAIAQQVQSLSFHPSSP